MWKSKTYGKLNFLEVFNIINSRISNNLDDYSIFVGTDSQSHGYFTHVVEVILVYKHGEGGFYFSRLHKVKSFNDLRSKIYYETSKSLDLAKEVTNIMLEKELYVDFIIHVDIGNNKKKGKTYELIPEIMGWIAAEGYKAQYKPNSPAASCIADMISK